MIMKQYMRLKKHTVEGKVEYILPIENIAFHEVLDNSYSISKPYDAEQIADYTIEKIIVLYNENILVDSGWGDFDKKATFGEKVYDLLQRFLFIRKNLTINESCITHNNPVLLEIMVALIDVREEYHERVNRHNKENEAEDFSDGYFGEKVESILVKRKYITQTVSK